MGNSSGVQKNKLNEPGAPTTNTTSNEGQIEGETRKNAVVKAAPKVIGEASEYELFFKAEAQNSQFTYDEEVEKFYSQIVVEAPKFELESRPSLDIVAVIDVSGSMSGEKISLVRKSMRRLVKNLGSNDRVALVTFDSQVQTVLNFCHLDEVNKKRAYDIISNLRAGTSTNLCGGIIEGVEHLLKNRVNDVASILLFTDGQANVGYRDTTAIVNEVLKTSGTQHNNKNVETWTIGEVGEWLRKIDLNMYVQTFAHQKVDGSIVKYDLTQEMLTETLGVQTLHASKFMREVEKLRGTEGENTSGEDNKTQGFRLHTFGFGSNHNSSLLQQLADNFDGMYFFMQDEESIKSGFANCLGGLMTTVALGIELSIQFNPECANGKVYKENVQIVDGVHKITFADLQSEETRNVLLSCSMPAKEAPVHDFLLFETTFKYNNAIADTEGHGVVGLSVNRNGKIEDFNEEVDEVRNRELTALALSDAHKLGEANDLVSARNRLQITIDEIDASRSSKNMRSVNLRKDLVSALDKARDRTTWNNEGAYYTVQNAMCHKQQRACNFMASDYAGQDDYNTSARREMDVVWSRADSLDSDCDDYNVD